MVKSSKAKEKALQKQLFRMVMHKDPVTQIVGGATKLSETQGYKDYQRYGKYLLTEPFYVNFKGIKGLSKAHVKSALWKHVKEFEDPIGEAKLIFKRINKEPDDEFPSPLELFHAVVAAREDEMEKCKVKKCAPKKPAARRRREKPREARHIKLVGDGANRVFSEDAHERAKLASSEAETRPLKITKGKGKGKLKMEDGLVTGEISQEVLREAVKRIMEGMDKKAAGLS